MSNILKQYNDKVKNFISSEQFVEWIYLLGDINNTPSSIRQKENFVKGCQSDLWITSTQEDNKFFFTIDSDVNFVRGIGRILTDVFSNCTKEEIDNIKFTHFKCIAQYLSLPRKKGMQVMINKIHHLTKQ